VARATWSGAISFGLVTVPVQMFTAVRSQTLRFRQLHAETKAPVKQKRVDAETGEEVSYDDIVKGYEVPGGGYVVVDPAELAELDPAASRLVDIRDFVEQAEIDPIYYDRPYYLAPDGEAAAKPYRLLTEAMERSGKVAIASFVMRNKEHLAAIRAQDGLLVLSTMHHADEVADPAELDVSERLADVEVRDREVEMAEKLIDSLLTDFDPHCYPDEHRARVEAYLEAKAEGQEVEMPTSDRETGNVVDLVAALEQSLERAKGGGDRAGAEQSSSAGSGSGSSTGSGSGDDYASMSKRALYELAQQRDIPGRSGLSKDELVEALRASESEAGAA
jgi:DNA end-binding protein Ku